MIKEADDFRAECDALAALLDGASDDDFQLTTLFNDWTIEDVIGHLHVWNEAAAMTLASREKFQAFLGFAVQHVDPTGGSRGVQYAWFDEHHGGLRGKPLYDAWRDFYPRLADRYAAADPKTRVAWAGPDMSAPSKIIARQMETWAHGQEIFDRFGEDRVDSDRIRNIAHLGVTTYSWTFRNRGDEPPKPKPYVRLTAPSGAVWEWNDPQDDNLVSGAATDFCQVVTQTRNIADTALETSGDAARAWMECAQCFAGPPKTPPAKGERRKHGG
ncbi:MAG: TIGR03084 family metal-binding protein [Pseudomonadota bacterium]